MSKQAAAMIISIVLVLLLICPVFTTAARPAPQLPETSGRTAPAGEEYDDELCKGVVGDEECRMMRRELAAHLDYIYTQNKKT